MIITAGRGTGLRDEDRRAADRAGHVGDVHADLDEHRLRVNLWNRILGLRLAPVQMDIGQGR